MSTRLGWAGLGGGREGRILHSGPRPAQAYVLWAPTVTPYSCCLFPAFCLPPTHLADVKLSLIGECGWELNTPLSLGPHLFIMGG